MAQHPGFSFLHLQGQTPPVRNPFARQGVANRAAMTCVEFHRPILNRVQGHNRAIRVDVSVGLGEQVHPALARGQAHQLGR